MMSQWIFGSRPAAFWYWDRKMETHLALPPEPAPASLWVEKIVKFSLRAFSALCKEVVILHVDLSSANSDLCIN